MSKDPSASSSSNEGASDDELLASLSGSAMLEMLGLTSDDLGDAHEDSDLLQTLRISYEVLGALRDANALGTFMRLPKDQQTNFLRWISATDDRELVRKRTATFVIALHESPLASPTDDEEV